MKNKVIYYLSMHVLVAAFLLILSGFYVLFYPFNPVTFNVDPFKVDKRVYQQGDMILYTLDFKKHMNLKPVISYYLTDGVVFPLSKGGLSRPVGQQVRNLTLQIPKGYRQEPTGYRLILTTQSILDTYTKRGNQRSFTLRKNRKVVNLCTN